MSDTEGAIHSFIVISFAVAFTSLITVLYFDQYCSTKAFLQGSRPLRAPEAAARHPVFVRRGSCEEHQPERLGSRCKRVLAADPFTSILCFRS